MISAKAAIKKNEKLYKKRVRHIYKSNKRKILKQMRRISKSDTVLILNSEIYPGIEKFLQKCQKKGYFVYESKCANTLDSTRYRIQLKDKCYSGYGEYPLSETKE